MLLAALTSAVLGSASGQLAVEEQVLLPLVPNPGWGASVELGAPWAVVSHTGFNTGEVSIFERQGQAWVEVSTPTSSGRAAAIAGRRVLYGRKSSVVAPALEHEGGQWQAYPQIDWPFGDNHDQFGWAIAMHGTRAAISAQDWGPGLGGIFVYDDSPAGWVFVHSFDPSPWNQWGLGDRIDLTERWVVSPTATAVLAYDMQTLTGAMLDPGGTGPRSAAVSGDVLVIGKPDEQDAQGVARGAVYVFEHDGTSWMRGPELRASDGLAGDQFGISVSLDGDVLLVGALGVDQPAGLGDGAAYVFRRLGDVWAELGRFGRTTPGSSALFAYDLDLDGELAVIGSSGAAYAFRLDLSLPPTAYCTAGTTASGCAASVSAMGTPSASQGAGFVVSVTGAEGQKDGTLYFGLNGPQASPWGNGTSFQCVAPPVRRTGALQGSGSAGTCTGSFQLDFNAWMATHPQAAPSAGADVALQCWFRDPLSTSNRSTSLSDALLFTVCP